MEDYIKITQLNDFIFCPVSIYFHNLYEDSEPMLYQGKAQIDGKNVHKAIDENRYSTKKDIITSLNVYSEKYKLMGKIDIYSISEKCLIERKNRINNIYDGYIFQLYAQYFAMKEMGYFVEKIQIHSISDNKKYGIPVPEENEKMFLKFESVIQKINEFQVDDFEQDNIEKCKHCIYEAVCYKSIK